MTMIFELRNRGKYMGYLYDEFEKIFVKGIEGNKIESIRTIRHEGGR